MKKTKQNSTNYSFVLQKSPLHSQPQLQLMSDDKDPSVYKAYKEKCSDPCGTSYLSCVHAAICKNSREEECETNSSVIMCWLPAVVASLACFPVAVCCGVSTSCCGFFAYHCGNENDNNSDASENSDDFQLQGYR